MIPPAEMMFIYVYDKGIKLSPWIIFDRYRWPTFELFTDVFVICHTHWGEGYVRRQHQELFPLNKMNNKCTQ